MPIRLTQYTRAEAIQNAGSNDKTTVTIVDDSKEGVERCVQYACERLQCIPADCDGAFFGWPQELSLSDFQLEIDNGTKKSSKFIQKIEDYVVVAWVFKSKRNSKDWPAGQTVFCLATALKARDERIAKAEQQSAGY